MKVVWILFALLVLSSPASALEGTLVDIEGRSGWLHIPHKKKVSVPQKSWMGFRWLHGDYRLEPITIMETKMHTNDCMGGKDAEIIIKPTPDLRFVVHSPNKLLKPGRIVTAFAGKMDLTPGANVTLGLHAKTCEEDPDSCYHLRAVGKTVKEDGADVFRGYKVFLQHKKKEEVIFEQSKFFTKPVAIRWAGDFDRDGKLDLILNQNYWPGAIGTSLYLSAPAEGRHIKLYAEQNPEQC